MDEPLWLLPTDFSPGAEAAFQKAVELGSTSGVRLLVLHVVLDLKKLPGFFITTHSVESLQRELEEEAHKKLYHLQRESEEAGIPTRVELLCGTPVPTILKAALDERAAMIVIGQAATDKAERQLCGGSTAAGLIRHPPCPVLVVPPPTG